MFNRVSIIAGRSTANTTDCGRATTMCCCTMALIALLIGGGCGIDSAKSEPVPAQVPDQEQAKPEVIASKGQWPLFRGNSAATGTAESGLPESLSVLWRYEIPDSEFESTPIIVDLKGKKSAIIGDGYGRLMCFDIMTGDLRWETKTEWGFVTAPAYQNGRIYIGDIDGIFYCFDENGLEVWRFQADDSIDSSANFFNNLVLFGSRDSRLYALDAETGKEAWRLDTGDQVRCSISVVEGRAFVAGCDGALHTIDLETGTEIGDINIESPTGVTPAAFGDLIFVGTEQSDFFGIDWKQSATKWAFDDELGSLSTRSSPAVVDGHVIFGARNRQVYSLEPETGKKNWSTELKANVDSSPVIVGDRVIVAAEDGRLYELELKTGKVNWQQEFNGGFVGSPAVGFERLVIATNRGVVYCLGSS